MGEPRGRDFEFGKALLAGGAAGEGRAFGVELLGAVSRAQLDFLNHPEHRMNSQQWKNNNPPNFDAVNTAMQHAGQCSGVSGGQYQLGIALSEMRQRLNPLIAQRDEAISGQSTSPGESPPSTQFGSGLRDQRQRIESLTSLIRSMLGQLAI